MSAVEVVSLLSTIISIVSAAIDVYDAYQDINGLPDVVKYALAQFHFVKDTLETVRNDVDEHRRNPNPKSYQAMKEILRSCQAKISSLDKIFSAIIPRPQKDTKTQPSFRQRFSRFTTAVSFTFNRGKKVEYLMKGVRQDIKLLAYNRILSPATRDQIKDTTERELGAPEPSITTTVVPAPRPFISRCSRRTNFRHSHPSARNVRGNGDTGAPDPTSRAFPGPVAFSNGPNL
ncbi:hypothetical protein N0V85_009469 [Neurospora sp. IMI 360204]|nr:hypothetical protein N0V85_009469 [Neurospora sp. IMI 360204]